jgi:hypothetical protein
MRTLPNGICTTNNLSTQFEKKNHPKATQQRFTSKIFTNYQSLFNTIVNKSKNAPITYAHAYNKQLHGEKSHLKGSPPLPKKQ